MVSVGSEYRHPIFIEYKEHSFVKVFIITQLNLKDFLYVQEKFELFQSLTQSLMFKYSTAKKKAYISFGVKYVVFVIQLLCFGQELTIILKVT